MIENDQHPDDVTDPDPILAGYEIHGTWPVVPTGRDPHDPDQHTRVTAMRADMIDPDGAYTVAGVELVIPACSVDSDGAVRMTAATARDLAAHLDHAAGVADRAVIA